MKQKTLLLTGFEPFNGCAENPSWLCVSAMADEIAGVRMVKALLPVAWEKGVQELNRLIDRYRPDGVLSFGLAGGRDSISIERVAVNLREAGIPDNEGVIRSGEPVIPGGPDGYFTLLPYEKIKAALEQAGLPASYSFCAGAYLCNSVMYAALYRAHTDLPSLMAGFVHIPYMSGQSETAFSMSLADLSKAASICCCTLCENIAAQGD